jgi:hypothetical protein
MFHGPRALIGACPAGDKCVMAKGDISSSMAVAGGRP